MSSYTVELIAAMKERGWTLGVAESLTGGAVCAQLVSVPGASAVVLGGIVAYATEVKATLLGVDADLLNAHGPVHPDVARQMALGVRRAVQVAGRSADVGISTTGIAGPESPDGQPVGTVHIAVATPEAVRAHAFVFEGDREQVRAQSTDAVIAAAVTMLRE